MGGGLFVGLFAAAEEGPVDVVFYGQTMGTNILLPNFNALLVIGFFLSLFTSKGSIGSILLARAAIHYFWVINSSGPSLPTDSEFISKFMKGLSCHKRKYKPVKKAYHE